MTLPPPDSYGEAVAWQPERPKFKPLRLVLSWAVTAASLWVAAMILPGVDIAGYGGALAVAAVVAALNAVSRRCSPRCVCRSCSRSASCSSSS
jgi:hypothetical protein